jgi:plasmid stabilization system protein ParE
MRSRLVRGFKKYLIFYRPLVGGGVEIIRVLHGAQDVKSILEGDT